MRGNARLMGGPMRRDHLEGADPMGFEGDVGEA